MWLPSRCASFPERLDGTIGHRRTWRPFGFRWQVSVIGDAPPVPAWVVRYLTAPPVMPEAMKRCAMTRSTADGAHAMTALAITGLHTPGIVETFR